ncbi:DgyrCDS8038 [Dimorphilus gyrociliatus]|uniref:DgyrCDS8038 n=1 Tax=Dimorphilus gyrociliatus TaxID=2664684 RepID=A0A7I8VXY5_9ANNE|nr:DgyrCDS8038 [Dimorphilus gyrociliatus]
MHRYYLALFFVTVSFIPSREKKMLMLTLPLTKYSPRDHFTLMKILSGKLAHRTDHEITFFIQSRRKHKLPRDVKELALSSSLSEKEEENFGHALRQHSKSLLRRNSSSEGKHSELLRSTFVQECKKMLTDSNFIERVEKENFDLLIIDQFFTYLDASVPTPMSWVPPLFSGFPDDMNYGQRIQSVILHYSLSYFASKLYKEYSDLKDSLNISPSKSIWDIRANSLLWLINSDLSFDYPRPLTPNIVHVGGMITEKSNENLDRDFLSLASHPFGIVSIDSEHDFCADEEFLFFLAEELSKVNDIEWIWSLRCPVNSGPMTVHQFRRIPRPALLENPNCRLIITNGDLNSIYEAVKAAVPLLIIPISGDGIDNGARLRKKGVAEVYDGRNDKFTKLVPKIRNLIENTSYLNASIQLSAIFNDFSPKPTEKAIFWINHVAKFGADHLRPAVNNLSTFQRYLFDVWMLIIFLILIVLLIIIFVTVCLVRCCWKLLKRNKTKSE